MRPEDIIDGVNEIMHAIHFLSHILQKNYIMSERAVVTINTDTSGL
jgi:hypothetical protein